jgi:hypothetical protein
VWEANFSSAFTRLSRTRHVGGATNARKIPTDQTDTCAVCVCACVCNTQLTLLPSTFTVFNGKKTTILLGDFFLLDAAAAGGPVDRVWDRGSLVAIEPSLRER